MGADGLGDGVGRRDLATLADEIAQELSGALLEPLPGDRTVGSFDEQAAQREDAQTRTGRRGTAHGAELDNDMRAVLVERSRGDHVGAGTRGGQVHAKLWERLRGVECQRGETRPLERAVRTPAAQ